MSLSIVAASEKEEKIESVKTYTVHDAIEAVGFGKFQIVLSIIAGFAWMADSMEIMLLSLITPSLVCQWGISSFEQAFCTTAVFIGWTISSPFWGWVCDRFGRKIGLILAAIMAALVGIGTAFSPSYTVFVTLRGFVGFAVGGVSQATTIYTEFLPVKARARCIIMLDVFWAIGSAFEALLALPIVPNMEQNVGWRLLVGLSSTPLALFALVCWWMPESPRFHVTRGKVAQAEETLIRMAKMNGKELPEGELVQDLAQERLSQMGTRNNFVGLFSHGLRTTTLLIWVIWFMLSFAYFGLSLYTTKLFQMNNQCHGGLPRSGNTTAPTPTGSECIPLTTHDYVDMIATSFAEVPGLIITVLIIEWLGRKKTLAVEMTLYSVAFLTLFICMGRTPMVIVIFIARAFISGAYQAAYVYTPEVYPTAMRATGMGIASGMSRIAAMITPLVAQMVADQILILPVGIYGVSGLIAAVASLLLPIETKGRQMRDVA